MEMIACELGVHRDSLHEWAQAHKEFSDARKLAKQFQLVRFQQMYLAGTTGQLRRVVSRTTTPRLDPRTGQVLFDATGKPIADVVEKFAPAQFAQAAAIFWGKAVHRMDEAGPLEDDDVEVQFD
jgi:hypothetical protein